MIKKSNKAFTLAELLLAAAILVFALAGLLALFINCILLNELNRNRTFAYTAIETKMEEIKNTSFDNLFVSCPAPHPANSFCDADTFSLEGISSGQAKIEINYASYDSSNNLILSKTTSSNLKHIRMVACFRSRNKLIGNSIDNCQSSPVELITLVVK